MREPRLAAAVLIAALAAAMASSVRAGERMSSETNDMPRGVVGGAGGLNGSASANYRLDAAFSEELGGSTVATASNRLAPGFVSMFSFPYTVTDLGALSDASISSVTLQWTTPGLDGARGTLQDGSSYYLRVASYTVPDTFALFDSADIVFSAAGSAPGTLVSTSAAGLQPNTTYWARLWTKDPAGGLSYASEISTFVTLALPVSLQSESFTDVHFTSAAAQWVARPSLLQDVSSMTAEGYLVEASSTNFGALIPGGVTSSSATDNVTLSTLTVSDPGLIVDKTYYFRVGALNWAGVPNWTVLGTTDTKFQVNAPLPVDPPYINLSTGSMTAYWDRNGNSSDTRYHAEASNTFDFTGEVTSTDTYNLFYSSGGLNANATYYFRVYATTRSASSAFASLGSTMTWAFAPAAAVVPLAAVHESSLTVRWLHNGNGADVSTYSVVATTSAVYPNTDDGNVILLSTRPGGADPLATLTGLELNTTYFLFGSGVNWIGAQGEFVLLGSTATRPAPPVFPGFEEVAFSSAIVSWSTNGNPLGVTTFTAVLSTVAAYPPGGAWDVVLSTVPDASIVMLTLDGLQLNATYHLFVTAVGHAHSAFTAGTSSATQAAPPGASPEAADYDPVTTTGFTLNWSSGAVAPGYDAMPPWTTYYADISVNSSFSPVLASSRTFNLSAPFTGLSVNTTYYSRVAAYSHHHGALLYTAFASSATMAAVPVAAAPTFVQVNFTSATLTWGGNGNPASITTYTVVFTSGSVYPNDLPDNVVLDTAPAGAVLSATISGLSSYTTYTLFVRAINHKGAETAWANLGSTRTLFSPKTWTGATNNLWNTATNWSPNGVPTFTDAVTIAAAANISAIGAQISFSSLTLGSPANPVVALTLSTTIAAGGSVLIYKNSGLTQATTRQLVITGDFTMVSGSSLSHTSESATTISSVNIRVTGTFDLQTGSTINVMGRGYRGGPADTVGFGPGGGGFNAANGKGGGGAAYGGSGGNGAITVAGLGSLVTYGSLTAPINMGSGGGGSGATIAGGSGGGVVIIDAGEMILNGVILSSGNMGGNTAALNPAGGGGGSGGGVFITAGIFSGSGSVDVQGGAGGTDTNGGGNGGGGGGGRASIIVTGSGVTCSITTLTAGGAAGGAGAVAGNAGTFNTADSLVAAQNLAGTAQSASSVLWNWSLTTGATDYQIFSSTGGPMSPPLGAAANYTTTGLAVNTTASFYVQARACGANLADSAPEDAATLALIPATIASPIFSNVSLSSMGVAWAASGNPVNVTSYTIVLSPETPFPNANAGNISFSTFPAGADLAATVPALDPNTTYYLFVAAKNHAGILTAYLDLSTAAATLALPVGLQSESFVTVDFTSASAQWVAHRSLLQDVSSMSAGGYRVEASSTNFGALTPGGAVYSSTTWNVLLSTLTVDIVPAPANLCETHYFRAASLNWAGLPNYTALGSTRAVDDYGVAIADQILDVGSVDVNTELVIPQSIQLANVGCPVTYHIKVTTITPGSTWVVATSSGADAFTVQAIFNSVQPASGDFEDIDKLTDVPATATLTAFAGDKTGTMVPVTEERLLWFKLGMPRSVSTIDPQDIRVTVYASPP